MNFLLNNPIKYPEYEEQGKNILTVDADEMLIELYKIHSMKKSDGTLYEHRYLIDKLSSIADHLNFCHEQAFQAMSELKSHGLVTYVKASNTLLMINLTSKAISYYDKAVGRQIKEWLSKGLSLFIK